MAKRIKNYKEASECIQDILEMLNRDGHLKTSYVAVLGAVASTLQRLANAEEAVKKGAA